MADTDGQAACLQKTQRTQTTRFQYPRGDKVIADFFATNVYKSAALIDVIYLFRLDYGPDADVSQILRDKLMAARSDTAHAQHDSAASEDMYTSGAPGSDDAADAASSEDAADDTAQPEPQPKQPKPKQQQQNKPKSTAEQADFNIAEMFD